MTNPVNNDNRGFPSFFLNQDGNGDRELPENAGPRGPKRRAAEAEAEADEAPFPVIPRTILPPLVFFRSSAGVGSRGLMGSSRSTMSPPEIVNKPPRGPNGTPPPPHRYRLLSSITHPFLRQAYEINQKNRFSWRGREVTLTVRGDLMRGLYAFIASIAEVELPLISGISNRQILVKSFRDHNILVSNSPKEYVNGSVIEHVFSQYEALYRIGYPIVEIYNRGEPNFRECGYFLVEHVPYSFEEMWNNANEEVKRNYFEQLCNLFTLAYNNGIDVDLSPSNIRFREDGRLVLIDIRERAIDEEDMEMTFRIMVRSFAMILGEENSQRLYEALFPASVSSSSSQ